MKKDKNLTNLLYKEWPKWTKIKNICTDSNLKKLRTIEACPIFTGSYKEKKCICICDRGLLGAEREDV